MNEGILSRDFPQLSLVYFTLGDDEGVQLITFIIFFVFFGVNFVRIRIYNHLIASIFHVFLHSAKRIFLKRVTDNLEKHQLLNYYLKSKPCDYRFTSKGFVLSLIRDRQTA